MTRGTWLVLVTLAAAGTWALWGRGGVVAEGVAPGEPALAEGRSALDAPERSTERAAADEAGPLREVAPVAVPQEPMRVTAICVDELGDALAGVALRAPGLAGNHSALSDARGRVELQLGRDLERRAEGPWEFSGAPLAFEFSSAGRARRVVLGPPLETLEQHDCGRIVLVPGGTVVGRVLGADGLPRAGIAVYPGPAIPAVNEVQSRPLRTGGLMSLTLRSGAAGTQTDLDGRFELEGVSSAEAACVWAQGDGTYAAWTDSFSVRSGETLDVGTLTLEPLAPDDRIEGRVLDANGRALPRALLTARVVRERTLTSQGSMSRANVSGHFVLPAVAGEAHRVEAFDPEQPSITARRDGILGGARGVELRLAMQEPMAVHERVLRGRVLRRGEPEGSAMVTRHEYRDSRPPKSGRSRRTDAEGRFEFEPAPGQYRFEAQSADGAWVGASERVSISAGEPLAPVEIELFEAARITGAVVMDAGVSAHGIELRATGPHGLDRRTSSRSDGSFEFECLQPGTWKLVRISTAVMTSGDVPAAGAKTYTIELAPGEVANLEIDLRGGAQLEGRLSLGDQNYSTWFWSVERDQGKLGPDGTFRVPRLTKLGDVRLGFGARQGAWVVELMAPVSLAAGPNTWSLELPTGSVDLSGLPLSASLPTDGNFEAACTLRFERDDGTVWEAMPLTAVGGRVRIEHVPAGRVLVLRRDLGAWKPAGDGEVLGELDVSAGEAATFEWVE